MEVKYYKDFRHNYLIIKKMGILEKKYQVRMITDNQIKGLLSCKERHINGDMLFYYEITSKQSLASLYENRKISMEVLRRLFVRLKATCDIMAGFLLEEKYLVLHPEYIFVDVESNDFYFLYYPFEPEENHIQVLFEFLTDKVDCEDDRAVDVSYKGLDLIERDQFVLDEILRWFEEDVAWQEEVLPEVNEMTVNANGEFSDNYYNEKKEISVFRKMMPETKITGRLLIFLLGIAAVCIYVYQSYDMAETNFVYFSGLLLADVLMMFLCIIYYIYVKGISLREKRECEKKKNIYLHDEAVEIDMSGEEDGFGDQIYGKTIFIPFTENTERMLYGIGKGNKYQIDLSHLPVTVGKLTDVADMIIDEQSISRRHVKFSGDNGNIFMTDLNSTNGTFQNGVRLEPNESKQLEVGDEIRLGRLKFIYR